MHILCCASVSFIFLVSFILLHSTYDNEIEHAKETCKGRTTQIWGGGGGGRGTILSDFIAGYEGLHH